jgi:hypothetical protein
MVSLGEKNKNRREPSVTTKEGKHLRQRWIEWVCCCCCAVARGPVVAGVPPASASVQCSAAQWRLVTGEATMNDVEPLPKPRAAARV